MTNSNTIPTVDLSPFLITAGAGDEEGKKKAKDIITQACSDYGFFQIVNHGISLDLMNRAIDLSKTFFGCPDQEKLKFSPVPGAPLPAGYSKHPDDSADKMEYFLMFSPESTTFNIFPSNPPQIKDVLGELFACFSKTGQLLETILSDCLGLPPNYFLQEFNEDRSWDFMTALRYFQTDDDETENKTGLSEHEDGNCITFVIQDEVGGLQVRKDGEWIPVTPTPVQGTIVVNIGDVIQVLSNNKFKSATHRVIRPKGRSRYSCAFFYNLQGEKWVEPLPQFTREIGEAPKYRGFLYKDYQALRMRNKTHPPTRPQDVIHITHYAIPPP